MKNTDRRFMNLERKVGFFVLSALALIAALFVSIGVRQDIFTAKTSVYFVADTGRDISEGQAVKLSGFKIGKVRDMSLESDAQVRVELSILTKYMKWIKTDSVARLTKEGVIGESIIEISPGSKNAKEVAGEAVISFERDKGLSEMVEELKEEIQPALEDIKKIVGYINDPEGDIRLTLKNIRTFSEELPTTKRHIDRLLVDSDKNISGVTGKVEALIGTAQKTVSDADGMIMKIDSKLPDLLEKTGGSLENIRKTTEDISRAVGKTAPLIPPLVEKSAEAAEGAGEIADSVKKIWPIRSFIKPPTETTLKPDSYE